MKGQSELQTRPSNLGEFIARIVFYCLLVFIIISGAINFLFKVWKHILSFVTGLIIDKVDIHIQELSTFSDTDEKRRLHAILLLEKLNDIRAIDPLICVLQNDPVPINRATAAAALSKYNDERAFKALIEALRDEDSWVRHRVVESLKLT
ncbi:MAG: HEAT repeat domain-containing protein, partial [Candidatus Hodarchaeota archaeon]